MYVYHGEMIQVGLVAKNEMRTGKIMYPEETGGAPNNRQRFKQCLMKKMRAITFS